MHRKKFKALFQQRLFTSQKKQRLFSCNELHKFQYDYEDINLKLLSFLLNHLQQLNSTSTIDEGMTNGPPIFAYLVFGPGGVSREKLSKPNKAMAWRDSGALLGVQARLRRVPVRLGLG
jgi:hypothetical protein